MKKLDQVLACVLVGAGVVWAALVIGTAVGIAPATGVSMAFATAVFATGVLNTVRASGAKPAVRFGSIVANLLLMMSMSSGLFAQIHSLNLHPRPRLVILILVVVPEFLLSIVIR